MGTPEERIRKAIKKIAQSPRTVLFSEIDWVMTRLQEDLGHTVRRIGTDQHYTYTINELMPFQVCDHHKGQKEVKVCYVKRFVARMIDLGLYGD